jgi:hypothetical protein
VAARLRLGHMTILRASLIMMAIIVITIQTVNAQVNQTRLDLGVKFIKECNAELGHSNLIQYLTFLDSIGCKKAFDRLHNMTDGEAIYKEVMDAEFALQDVLR